MKVRGKNLLGRRRLELTRTPLVILLCESESKRASNIGTVTAARSFDALHARVSGQRGAFECSESPPDS
jgi:hypothetical protein